MDSIIFATGFDLLASGYGFQVGRKLELITFEILAAERLRLMGFDNRLIIDCFANVVNILICHFLQMIDSEVRNMNPIT